LLLPLLNYLLLPKAAEQVLVRPPPEPELDDDSEQRGLDHQHWVNLAAALLGLSYLTLYFYQGGGLNLNSISWLFLFTAIALHGTPARFLAALQQGIQGCSGILLQFPFYAGLMALMVQSGLAAHIAESVVRWSDAQSLPLWAFLSAGLINIFIPSGGGQWAVQGPVMLDAALALGADIPKVAMAVAWGDAWTNLIQPFWALPVLAIAGLKAKDILGFCIMQLLLSGAVIALVFRFF
jgi:short-chain fatty acids transporter